MASNPVNLALRFFLELAAWGSMGYWGWTQHDSTLAKIIFGIGLPVLAMAIWGTFRVPDDPREPPIKVRGIVRLTIEFVEFGLAVLLLYHSDRPTLAAVFGVIVVLHYLASYDRIYWLLTER